MQGYLSPLGEDSSLQHSSCALQEFPMPRQSLHFPSVQNILLQQKGLMYCRHGDPVARQAGDGVGDGVSGEDAGIVADGEVDIKKDADGVKDAVADGEADIEKDADVDEEAAVDGEVDAENDADIDGEVIIDIELEADGVGEGDFEATFELDTEGELVTRTLSEAVADGDTEGVPIPLCDTEGVTVGETDGDPKETHFLDRQNKPLQHQESCLHRFMVGLHLLQTNFFLISKQLYPSQHLGTSGSF